MKKTIAFLLISILSLQLFACSSPQSNEQESSSSDEHVETSIADENATSENEIENTESDISSGGDTNNSEETENKLPEETTEITDVMIGDTIEAEYATDFSVSRVFSNDMVVQRGEHIRVWGFAPDTENGKKVSGEFKGMFAEALIKNGEWCLTFGARLEADINGAEMRIFTDEKEIIFTGVLVGDVYMVIGQSNVEYDVSTHISNTDPLTQGGGKDAIDPNSIIRLNRSNHTSGGSYPSKLEAKPCADFRGNKQWTKTTVDDTLPFSALGYYFARNLVEKNGNTVPVGIIEIGFAGAPLGSFLPNEIAEKYKTDTKETSAGGYTTTGANGTGNGRFIYNHYIYPFEKYAIAGLVWYQGESNNSLTEARKYNEVFIALMEHMRATHNIVNKNYPILITEIPSIYKAPSGYSGANSWQFMDLGIIRAYMGAIPMKLDNCYIASGADIWTDDTYYNSLHPSCKFEQADRLADIAMVAVNKSGSIDDATGPILESFIISEDMMTATVKFTNVGNGLKTLDGSSPTGFVVYLDGHFDGKYVSPDKVEIVGKDTIIITHSEKFNGVAYNVASSDVFGKTLNLCNSANIPASAFSTDFTERKIEGLTASDFKDANGSVGYIGRFFDAATLDGAKLFSAGELSESSSIKATNESKNIQIRGWCGFNSEILVFGYAIDNEEAVFNSLPAYTEQAVTNAAGRHAKRFIVNADISDLPSGYHTLYLLAYIGLNGGTPVKLVTLQINKPEDNAEGQKFYSGVEAGLVDKNIDYLKVDGTTVIEGPSTQSIKSLEVNSQNKTLTFFGWFGFKTDTLRVGYAFDDEAAEFIATPTQTSESAVIARGGRYSKRFTINVNIGGLSVGEHKMYLLALVDTDGGKPAKLMEFTLKISEKCPHDTAGDKGWSAVAGEAKETATCVNCGETIIRNTNFIFCCDQVTHGGGKKVGSMGVFDSPLVIDSISNAFVTSKGLGINGWLCINSGTAAYKWSVNGKDWYDVDANGTYLDAPADVIKNVSSQSQKLGLKDFEHKMRFYINISGISKLEAGTYDVYLGVIPTNNPDAVVSVLKVTNVSVINTPDADASLKTINGIPISEYSIAVSGASFGEQYASTLLLREIYAISGVAPKISTQGTAGAKTILITSSYTYNEGNVGGGEYYFEVDGNSIIIGGSGIYGPIKAVDAFIDALTGNTDATVASTADSIVTLNNIKEKLENGESVSIGFIGDSVTYGHGPVTPWPTFFERLLKQDYSSVINTSNVARSGSTSEWGRSTIKSLLLDDGYNDLIFLAHGTNDKYNISDYSYEKTYDNYVSMINQIRSSNPSCDIVFVICGRNFEQKGIMGISGGSISPYMMAMIDVAHEYGIGIIDPMTTLYEAGDEYSPGNATGAGWRYYMQDEVHPNELGQELYGKVVYSYISSALK